jgi:hypothetical protein
LINNRRGYDVVEIPRKLGLPVKCGLAGFFSLASARNASAHVKWFCAYNVAGQPRGLENVLCQDFELLVGIAMLWLVTGCVIEGTPLGDSMIRALNRATKGLRQNSELIIRAACGFFFVAIWTMGGVLLTPELKSTSSLVPFLQLGVAAGMLSRRTLVLSALGIAILFALAVREYGAFHLADYPIFLGIAVYLALTGLQKAIFGIKPLDILRYATAITLMWASIEKWAFPEWSFPLFIEHPALSLGFDSEFYMRAAGVVEFTLAFALLWTPLVRRCAAIVLAGMFISAGLGFGKVDMIGHSAIIAVLFTIMSDDSFAERDRRVPLLAPVGFSAALTVTLLAYYVGHAAIFGTTIL